MGEAHVDLLFLSLFPLFLYQAILGYSPSIAQHLYLLHYYFLRYILSDLMRGLILVLILSILVYIDGADFRS